MFCIRSPAAAAPSSVGVSHNSAILLPHQTSTANPYRHPAVTPITTKPQLQQLKRSAAAASNPGSVDAWTGPRTSNEATLATADAGVDAPAAAAAAAGNGNSAETKSPASVSAPRIHPGVRPRPRSITRRTITTTTSSSSSSSMDESPYQPLSTLQQQQQQQQTHQLPELNPIDGQPFAQPRVAQPPVGATAAYASPAAARAAARVARAAAATVTVNTNSHLADASNGVSRVVSSNGSRNSGGGGIAVTTPETAASLSPSDSSNSSSSNGNSSNGKGSSDDKGSSNCNGSRSSNPQAKLAQAKELMLAAMKSPATLQDLCKEEIKAGELDEDVLPIITIDDDISNSNNNSNNSDSNNSSSSSSESGGSSGGSSSNDAGTYAGTLSKARELMLSAMSSRATLEDLCKEEIENGALDEDVLPILDLDDAEASSSSRSGRGSTAADSDAVIDGSSSNNSKDSANVALESKDVTLSSGLSGYSTGSSSASSSSSNEHQLPSVSQSGSSSSEVSSSSGSSSTSRPPSRRRTRSKSHSAATAVPHTSNNDGLSSSSSSSGKGVPDNSSSKGATSSDTLHDITASSSSDSSVKAANGSGSSEAAVMQEADAADVAAMTNSTSSASQASSSTDMRVSATAAAEAGSSRRRVRGVNSSSSSSSSGSSAAAVQQLLAGQRDLAAAQRRAAAAGSKQKKKSPAVASSAASSNGSSSRGKPGDVVYANGSWVMVGFEEDKQALQQLVPVLQGRLRSAVEAEQQHEEALIKSLYAKNNIRRLQKDGLVLLGLQAVPHDVLYSSLVWKFTPSSNGGGGGQRVLPYHRFRQGDSLLISQYAAEQAPASPSNGQQGSTRPGASGGPDSIRPLDATVLEVRKEYLLLTVDKSDSDQLQRTIARSPAAALAGWRLDQSVRDTTARRQLDAISRLAHMRQPNSPFELLLRSTIVGTPNGHYVATLPPMWVRDSSWRKDVRDLLAGVQNLNTSQKRAIAQAITRSLTLWQGPPGTGKTRTLLALVEVLVKTALLQSSRWQAMGPLLACADTNAAVDNLVEGLVGKGLKVVRLGQPAKVRASLRHLTLEAQAEATPLGQRAAALREASKALFERAKKAAEGSSLAWASNSSSSTLITSSRTRRSSPSTNSSSSSSKSPVSVGQLDSESLEADAKRKWGQAEALSREASKLVLSQAHVVCATCAGSGDPMLADMHFNVVVIDEATQATEPATLVPLTQGAQCAVMAGDPCQLPPTIISRQAYAFNLDKTLFDRLQQDVGLTPLLLDTQYRMNPAISKFPSLHFYGGKLQDGVSAAVKPAAAGVTWPVADHPVMVVELQGLEEKAQKSGEKARNGKNAFAPATADVTAEVGLEDASYRNLPEARVALQALYALMKQGDAASGAILTPYKGQVRSLEHGLRVLAPWFTGMDVIVSSVDGYQGREADVIVFTAVRSNNTGRIGFVSDPRRLNVAITRPRRGLVVVCDPATLAQGSADWSKFVDFAEQQGYICGPQQLPVAPWQEEGLDPFSVNASVAVAGNHGDRTVVGTLSSAEEV